MNDVVTIYRCYFEYQDINYSVDSQPDIPAFNGIHAFSQGFWINLYVKGPELSFEGDLWIPPAKIKHILKFNEGSS